MGEPVRSCIGCGARKPKQALIRLALSGEEVVVDLDARLPGRGAYVCGEACAQRALQRRALQRAFRGRPTQGTPIGSRVLARLGSKGPGRGEPG